MCISGIRPAQKGFTLIELIVFIVIVSVGLVGVLASLNISVKSSADPVQPKQALAIAEAMMDEVLNKSFCDPDLTAPACTVSREATRDDYDDVQDYATFDVTGDDGSAFGGVAGYRVVVSVSSDSFCANGGANAAWKVVVTVTPPGGNNISLTGYKCNF
jgi:MSHA pilin protein MshD